MKVIFYKAKKGNFLDHCIDLVTGKLGYSHVELAVKRISNDPLNYDCYSISPRERKSRYKSINIYSDNWDVYDIDEKYLKRRNITSESIFKQTQKKIFKNATYDFIGILLTHIIKLNLDNPYKLYCSECVGKLLRLEDPFISPNKLFEVLIEQKIIKKSNI